MVDPFKYKGDMFIKTGNTNYDSFGPLSEPSFDINKIVTPFIPLDFNLTASNSVPLPSQEVTQSAPVIAATQSVTPVQEDEEFLSDREDQETATIFEVLPIIGIKTAEVSFEGVEIKKGKSYSTTLKSVGIVGKTTKERIKNFFEKFKQEALNSSNNDYVFPELTLAQAIIESGYGKFVINTGNFFGVTKGGWKGDYGVYKTKEGNPNTRVNTSIGEENLKQSAGNGLWWYKRAFRHYASVAEGFKDHNKVLQNPTYYKGYDEQGTPEGQLQVISVHYGGKTPQDYIDTLTPVINELKVLFAGTYNVVKEGKKYKIVTK